MIHPIIQICTNRLRVASALLALCLSGCSHQDFSTPVKNPLSSKRSLPTQQAISNDDALHAERRMEQLMSALVALESPRDHKKDAYRIGPGDKLEFSIRDLEAPGQSSQLEREVMGDGQLSLPWIGDVDVEGLTLDELQDRVIDMYRGDYIRNPEVNITIASFENVEVLVTGAVRKPGVYHLEQNQTTLIELLATVGGMNENASDEVLVIRSRQDSSVSEPTGNSTVDVGQLSTTLQPVESEVELAEPSMRASIQLDPMIKAGDEELPDNIAMDAAARAGVIVPIDLKQLLGAGDMSLNVTISDGDIVNVRPKSRRFVYVLGYVNRPGSFEMPAGRDLDPVRAVALAGGLAASARAQNSFVVRETGEGQQIIQVNLVKAARGEEESFTLASGDTLVIGSSTMGRLGEFVKPSAGVGVDAIYSPVP